MYIRISGFDLITGSQKASLRRQLLNWDLKDERMSNALDKAETGDVQKVLRWGQGSENSARGQGTREELNGGQGDWKGEAEERYGGKPD